MTTAATTRPSTAPDLAEVLAGRLGVRALRELVRAPVAGPASEAGGESVELLRTKYKPGRKLTAYYRWGVDEEHVSATTWHADGRTTVLVSPADPAMPQLARLCDVTRLAPLLSTLAGGPVCRSPRELSVGTIRYRPGQRHVLHVRGGRLGPAGLYLKLDRDASGAHAVPLAVELAEHLPVVTPVGYDATERVAVWHGAPGQPLWRRLRERPSDGPRLVRAVGRSLRALHDSPVRVERTHSVAAEAESTLRAGEHIAALLPPEGDRFRAAVGTAMTALDRWPVEPATLGHGDAKCDNLLADEDERLRFLDLDRVALAEPALDLAKLLADLRWWCTAARLPALHGALRAGYGPCDRARWARAELLAALLGAKLVARRCAIHDPAWEATVRERLDQVTAALENVGAGR